MSTTAYKTGDEDSSAREWRGQWWAASSPDIKAAGVLRYSSKGGAVLELNGGISSIARLDDPPSQTVFGISEGVPITLAVAWCSYRRLRGIDPQYIEEETWQSVDVFLGAHAPRGRETRFQSFELRTRNLSRWASRAMPALEREGNSTRITIQTPDAVTADLGDGRGLELTWQESSHHKFLPPALEFTVTPCLVLRLEESIASDSAWRSFVTPAVFFLTLATGHGDQITRLSAELDASESGSHRTVEILVSRWTEPLPALPNSWEHTLQYVFVRDRFQSVMPAWFEMVEQARDSLLDFFSIQQATSMFLEEQFIRVSRCIESWHRRMVGGTQMPEEDFQALLGSLRGFLEPEAWEFVKMRLQYGNERTLKRRLDDILADAAPQLQTLVASYSKFFRRTVNTRNSLTHDGRLGDDFRPEELWWAVSTLDLLLRDALLRRLGLSHEEVEQALARAPQLRELQSPQNPLRVTPAAV